MANRNIAKIMDYTWNNHRNEVAARLIYHYTGAENVPKIIHDQEVLFRLTKAENFKDKHEGRNTVEVYYDLAIEQLLQEQIIDKKTYDMLAAIEMPEYRLFSYSGVFDTDPLKKTKMVAKKYDTYVMCFSVIPQDPYMYEHFVKGDTIGHCLAFNPSLISWDEANFNPQGYKYEIVPVIYGSDILKEMHENLKELFLQLEKPYDEMTLVYLEMAIREYLSSMRFRVKLNKYRNENEVRLIVYVPQEKKGKVSSLITIKTEARKKYCYCKFPSWIYEEIHSFDNSHLKKQN